MLCYSVINHWSYKQFSQKLFVIDFALVVRVSLVAKRIDSFFINQTFSDDFYLGSGQVTGLLLVKYSENLNNVGI